MSRGIKISWCLNRDETQTPWNPYLCVIQDICAVVFLFQGPNFQKHFILGRFSLLNKLRLLFNSDLFSSSCYFSFPCSSPTPVLLLLLLVIAATIIIVFILFNTEISFPGYCLFYPAIRLIKHHYLFNMWLNLVTKKKIIMKKKIMIFITIICLILYYMYDYNCMVYTIPLNYIFSFKNQWIHIEIYFMTHNPSMHINI